MEKRTISLREAKLPQPAEERYPKKKIEENGYTKRAMELLDEQAQQFPLHNISMAINHKRGTVEFTYEKRDLQWEYLKHRIDEMTFQYELSKLEERLLKGVRK